MKQTPTHSTITNINGRLRTLTGPNATHAYRFRMIKTCLRLWKQTGIQPTRGVKILKVAQQATGLLTRNVDTLTAALDDLITLELSLCEIGTLTTPTDDREVTR